MEWCLISYDIKSLQKYVDSMHSVILESRSSHVCQLPGKSVFNLYFLNFLEIFLLCCRAKIGKKDPGKLCEIFLSCLI